MCKSVCVRECGSRESAYYECSGSRERGAVDAGKVDPVRVDLEKVDPVSVRTVSAQECAC